MLVWVSCDRDMYPVWYCTWKRKKKKVTDCVLDTEDGCTDETNCSFSKFYLFLPDSLISTRLAWPCCLRWSTRAAQSMRIQSHHSLRISKAFWPTWHRTTLRTDLTLNLYWSTVTVLCRTLRHRMYVRDLLVPQQKRSSQKVRFGWLLNDKVFEVCVLSLWTFLQMCSTCSEGRPAGLMPSPCWCIHV